MCSAFGALDGGVRLLCKASFSSLFVYDLLQLHALSPYLFLSDFGAYLCGGCLLDGRGGGEA